MHNKSMRDDIEQVNDQVKPDEVNEDARSYYYDDATNYETYSDEADEEDLAEDIRDQERDL